MAGFEEYVNAPRPAEGVVAVTGAVGRLAGDEWPGNGGVTTARSGRRRAGLAVRRGHSPGRAGKRHVAAA